MEENKDKIFIDIIMYFILGHYSDLKTFLKYGCTSEQQDFIVKYIDEHQQNKRKF